jgi:hypothetical protein
LAADQSGLEVQSLHADLGCAIIAGVVFESVAFDYDAQGRHWEAQGTVEAIPGVTLHGDITFEHGAFVGATVSLGNEGYAVPPWQISEAKIFVTPTDTGGDVVLSLYPVIPGLRVSLLDIQGGYDFWWAGGHPKPGDPPSFEVKGMASTLGVPVANGWIRYYPTLGPEIDVHAEVQADLLDVLRVHAWVDGSIWHWDPSALRFNFQAGATLSVFDLINVDGQALVSDNGIAGCVGIGLFGWDVQVGGWIRWSNLSWHPVFAGCDVSAAQDAQASRSADVARVSGRAAQTGFTVRVASGTRDEVIGMTGAGAPPAVALTGPRGQSLTVPSDHPVLSAREIVVHDTKTATTFVILRAPSAGRWTVSALPGSPAVTGVQFATTLPPASIKAKVTGAGRFRTLSYRIVRIPGQAVQFFEHGDHWERPIGQVTGGGAGAIRFTPAPAAAGRRRIVAQVEQYGHPREETTVASYLAPPPPRLVSPGALRAARRGGSLKLTWRPVAGAGAYAITIHTSDRRTVSTVVPRPRFTLLRFGAATTALVTVTPLDATGRGPIARIMIRSARARPGRHRRRF